MPEISSKALKLLGLTESDIKKVEKTVSLSEKALKLLGVKKEDVAKGAPKPVAVSKARKQSRKRSSVVPFVLDI